jgi:hypothetical protein
VLLLAPETKLAFQKIGLPIIEYPHFFLISKLIFLSMWLKVLHSLKILGMKRSGKQAWRSQQAGVNPVIATENG